eukprot:5270636-Karenia_brevis.AAC.1
MSLASSARTGSSASICAANSEYVPRPNSFSEDGQDEQTVLDRAWCQTRRPTKLTNVQCAA